MENKLAVGWSAFTQWELELARGKARGLAGKYGFAREDAEDITQELLLETHLKRTASEKWAQANNAPEKAVMRRILDKRIYDLIESASTEKRRGHNITDSLSAEVGRAEDGSPTTLEDFLGDDHLVAFGRQPTPTPHDLEVELSLRSHKLSSIQLRISDLIKQGYTITEIAEKLVIKRTTLNREIDRMRALFYEEGLQAYLK